MIKSYFFLEGASSVDPFLLGGAEAAERVRAAIPGLTGYVQTRALDEQIGDDSSAYVGAAELWFSDTDAALADLPAACSEATPASETVETLRATEARNGEIIAAAFDRGD